MRTKKINSVLIILGLTISLQAASNTIPFRFVGKLILIQATVDGQKGNYILDTGVSYLVLNAKYFDGEPTDRVFKGVNGQAGQIEISSFKVEIGPHSWKSVYAEIISMDHFRHPKGLPIHGLIGSKLFQRYELWIDFQAVEIALYPLDKKGENTHIRYQAPPSGVLPFKNKGSTPVITARLGSRPLQLMFDTGAEINLIHVKYKKHIQAYLHHKREKLLAGFSEQSKNATAGKVSHILIGQQNCRPMNTLFASIDELNRSVPGPKVDGIIGYEFLKQFRVAINFKKREMYLWPYAKTADKLLASE